MKGYKQSKRAPVKGWKTRNRFWKGNDFAGWLAGIGVIVAAMFRHTRR